jgi:hypothetical protein
MSEPFLERLSGFTPDAGRLDRDALLFAAGRRSARPNRGWMTLASVLAGTQALSLVLLWPRPAPPAARFIVPVAAVPAPPADLAPPTSRAPVGAGLRWARHSLMEAETPDRPADVTFIDRGPPLRAFPTPPSLLN